MPNTIALAKSYLPMLDKVFKKASLTSHMTTADNMVKQGNKVNEILVPKLSMSGLGDYARNGGYVSGDVTLEWETVKFNYDRGRKFEVDYLDDEESANTAFAMLGAEFVRTKVAPEADAFYFAKLCGISGVKVVQEEITNAQAFLQALITATTFMDEAEVPEEDRHLFATSTLINSVMGLQTIESKEVLAKFASVTKVPQSRFYSAIDLLDGKTSDQEIGGFKKNATAKDINFSIQYKPSVLKWDKHIANDIITPQANQSADAYMQKYRKYGIVDAYENKLSGIYFSTKTA